MLAEQAAEDCERGKTRSHRRPPYGEPYQTAVILGCPAVRLVSLVRDRGECFAGGKDRCS
jgi:hypothetical protein